MNKSCLKYEIQTGNEKSENDRIDEEQTNINPQQKKLSEYIAENSELSIILDLYGFKIQLDRTKYYLEKFKERKDPKLSLIHI